MKKIVISTLIMLPVYIIGAVLIKLVDPSWLWFFWAGWVSHCIYDVINEILKPHTA